MALRIIRRLLDLLDVNADAIADGETLVWDSAAEEFIPGAGGGGGAPTDATYLVTASHADLSAEVPVGATPGGELGGTWASPTVDATHSGSSHAAVQTAAEATAAAALAAHEADTTGVHGIADTSALALTANHPSNATFNDHSARHEDGGADEISIAGLAGTSVALQAHLDDATDAHDASAVSVDSTNLSGTGTTVQASLEELDNLLDDHSARHENGGADEISLAGLDGTPTALTDHLNDATDAHDASAISVLDAAGDYTGTDVEAVLAEIADLIAAAGGSTDGWTAADAMTYASATTLTVAGDLTARYSKGTRIKLTQTTEKYFVVVSSSHAAGTTTVTITGGDDYTLANAAITAPYYSYEANPQGYPGWFSFNSSVNPTGYSAITTEILRFSVVGRKVSVLASFDGTSNATTLTCTLPITTHSAAANNLYPLGFTRNNGAVATTPGRLALANSSTTATFTRDMGGAAWTASGQKTVVISFDYEY